MVKLWKDDPKTWEEVYDDQDTRTLAEWGISGSTITNTQINFVDPPEQLKELKGKTASFWNEILKSREGSTNGKLYGITGINGVDLDGKTLVLNFFETNYATLLQKVEGDDNLTEEESDFLRNNLIFPGVGGYVRDITTSTFLVGKVARRNFKQDLWEYVPQGLIKYGQHLQEGDPFLATLQKELEQETRLSLDSDFGEVKLTHLNIGPKFGNFTPIYQLLLKHNSFGKTRASNEHLELQWHTKGAILNPSGRYDYSPGIIPLIEKI